MRQWRPSQVYYFGTGADLFTTGIYLSGYPLFLWHFVGESGLFSVGLISIAISLSFFFEFLAEVLSSFAADRWGFSRRPVFLIGWLLPFFTLAILASFKFWISSTTLTMIALVSAQFCYQIGYCLYSGTFDGWAVTAELAQNRHFSKPKFFTTVGMINRLSGASAAIFVIVSVVIIEKVFSATIKPTLWTTIWGAGAVLRLSLWIVLYFLSKGHDSVQKGHRLPPMSEMLKNGFQPAALSGIVLLTGMYVVGILVTYSWPVIIDLAGPRPTNYLLAMGLYIGASIGSVLARRKSRQSTDQTAEEHALQGSLFTALLMGSAGIVLFLTNETYVLLGIIAFGLLVVMRVFYFYGHPFIISLIHSDIGEDENVRACIVSLRMGVANLAVGFTFLLHKFVYDHVAIQPFRLLGITIVIGSLAVLLSTLMIKQRRQSSAD